MGLLIIKHMAARLVACLPSSGPRCLPYKSKRRRLEDAASVDGVSFVFREKRGLACECLGPMVCAGKRLEILRRHCMRWGGTRRRWMWRGRAWRLTPTTRMGKRLIAMRASLVVLGAVLLGSCVVTCLVLCCLLLCWLLLCCLLFALCSVRLCSCALVLCPALLCVALPLHSPLSSLLSQVPVSLVSLRPMPERHAQPTNRILGADTTSSGRCFARRAGARQQEEAQRKP